MKPPTIEFPCDYPIKVVGMASDHFVDEVLAVVADHARPIAPDDVAIRDSRHGKYRSLTLNIWATGEVQLKALHADLVARKSVKLVL